MSELDLTQKPSDGNRIELGGIETVLGRHPGVWSAVVLPGADGAGEKRLVAYVTIHPPIPTVSDLREYLKQHLPDDMVPAVFVFLDEFPLTPDGKVDRAALPAPDEGTMRAGQAEADPLMEVEQTVTNIIAGLLGLERVETQANFFDLGGNSLLATQLIARVRDKFGVELPLRKVFASPTISGLSAEIEKMLIAEIEAMSDEEVKRSLDGPATGSVDLAD